MRECKKCLENNWTFEYIDGWIRATCVMCSNEVEFESRRKKKENSGERIGKGITTSSEDKTILLRNKRNGNLEVVKQDGRRMPMDLYEFV